MRIHTPVFPTNFFAKGHTPGLLGAWGDEERTIDARFHSEGMHIEYAKMWIKI